MTLFPAPLRDFQQGRPGRGRVAFEALTPKKLIVVGQLKAIGFTYELVKNGASKKLGRPRKESQGGQKLEASNAKNLSA